MNILMNIFVIQIFILVYFSYSSTQENILTPLQGLSCYNSKCCGFNSSGSAILPFYYTKNNCSVNDTEAKYKEQCCRFYYGNPKDICSENAQRTACQNNFSNACYTCQSDGCYIHCNGSINGTFVGDPHMTDFYGRKLDVKVNQPGYYNVIDDPMGEEELVLNERIYIKKLKNGAGIVGDWIDGTFLTIKNNQNGTKIYTISYTTNHPNGYVIDGEIIETSGKYILFAYEKNHKKSEKIIFHQEGKQLIIDIKNWKIIIQHVEEYYSNMNESIRYQNIIIKMKAISMESYQTIHGILGQTIRKHKEENNLIIEGQIDDYLIVQSPFDNHFKFHANASILNKNNNLLFKKINWNQIKKAKIRGKF